MATIGRGIEEGGHNWLGRLPGWEELWYKSVFGFSLVTLYMLIVLTLVLITTREVQTGLGFSLAPLVAVPIGLYVAGALGAFGYVFTRLFIAHGDDITEVDDSLDTITLFRVGLTIIGALPLVFGVYVVAGNFNVESIGGTVAAAFLTGMFVKTIYGAFGDIADRLSSSKQSGDGRGSERSDPKRTED